MPWNINSTSSFWSRLFFCFPAKRKSEPGPPFELKTPTKPPSKPTPPLKPKAPTVEPELTLELDSETELELDLEPPTVVHRASSPLTTTISNSPITMVDRARSHLLFNDSGFTNTTADTNTDSACYASSDLDSTQGDDTKLRETWKYIQWRNIDSEIHEKAYSIPRLPNDAISAYTIEKLRDASRRLRLRAKYGYEERVIIKALRKVAREELERRETARKYLEFCS